MPRTQITAFAPEHLPAVTRFTQELWPWPDDPGFYRWRFLDCAAFQHVYLAIRGDTRGDDKCLAMICAFERELLVDGERRRVLDGFDWATADEPGAGTLGFFVMQALFKEHRLPILGFSGTEISMALRSRLGFESLDPVPRFVLPVAGSGGGFQKLATGLAARFWFRPRKPEPPAGARVVEATGVGPEILALYEGETSYRSVLLPDLELYRWVLSQGDPEDFLPLHFFVGGELRGWTLARIYEAEGRKEAALLECFAPRPSTELYGWMVAETLAHLAPFKLEKVRAAASCPLLARALRGARFLERRPIPLDYKSQGEELPGTPRHLTWNGADFTFRPYARWGEES